MDQAVNNTPQPSYLAPLEIVMYVLVYLVMGLASGVLFLINCSSFILYGVTALFGPIFVPLLMSRTFRRKVLPLYRRAVGLCHDSGRRRSLHLRLVWLSSDIFESNIQWRLFNRHVDHNFFGVMSVFIAFILNMVMVPAITQVIFGGGAGAAGRVGQILETAVIRAAVMGV